ncbi:sensor histidine kinase [Nocardioides aurantiacus]|uniref:histidine kinase n=1 Tax=Nocardioides aurantiacus TaxID=86796 RepID=A0A3N2CQ79_9ACTN|nr:ATP-binding protein [Nocardioides aurantiacus]ROR89677.1 signal transduction histidine kinase regulating citrate/malate metabolism [Nocardioides aurantiacus]
MVTVTSGRRRDPSLAAQVLVLQLVVVVGVLALVAVISLRQSGATFRAQSGSQMRGVAEYVADTFQVRTKLEEASGRATGTSARDTINELAPTLDAALTTSAADEIDIATPDGEVLVSSDPLRVGERIAVEGRAGAQWSGLREVDGATVVAARAPVLSDEDGQEGDLVGLVLVEQDYPSVWERLTSSAANLALFLGLGALLGVLGTYVVSRVVKRRTHGLGASEIARLADHREALLHSIREGVLAVGTDGRVTMVNDAALDLLALPADPVGQPVAGLGLADQVVALLDGSAPADEDAVAVVADRVLVFNRRTASSGGSRIGTVTTMRDRTELVSLQSQLSSNLSISDTLRAQTHEFSNQLHTISGLVQLGEYDEVRSLVGTLTRRRAESEDFVTSRIDDLAVAALVLAKASVAAERGVRLELTEDSALPPLVALDSADLTTVLGNLVDNAIDACSGRAGAEVTVALQSGTSFLHVEVGDNGPGVPEELRGAIFVRGWSTKPDVLGGRGIGLPLVQLICAQRGGSIEVHQRDGAVFSVRLPYSATRRVP